MGKRMSDRDPAENPFRELDALKDRLPSLWGLHTASPESPSEPADAAEPAGERLEQKPAA